MASKNHAAILTVWRVHNTTMNEKKKKKNSPLPDKESGTGLNIVVAKRVSGIT